VGVISNYRVRQVLGLGAMPERQLRFLIALATWMSDETRTVRVGFETLIRESGKSHNTIRNARRELEAAGKLASHGGRGKGNLTVWTALCLPEKGVSDVDPHADPKGTSEVGTFSGESKGTSEVGTFTSVGDSAKGTNREPQKVPTGGSKRYQPQPADQPEPEMGFNSRAKPLSPGPGSLHAELAAVVPDVTERETRLALEELKSRPRVQSPRAVLLHEIKTGGGPDLVALVRQNEQGQQAESRPPSAIKSADCKADDHGELCQQRDRCSCSCHQAQHQEGTTDEHAAAA